MWEYFKCLFLSFWKCFVCFPVLYNNDAYIRETFSLWQMHTNLTYLNFIYMLVLVFNSVTICHIILPFRWWSATWIFVCGFFLIFLCAYVFVVLCTYIHKHIELQANKIKFRFKPKVFKSHAYDKTSPSVVKLRWKMHLMLKLFLVITKFKEGIKQNVICFL